MRSIKFRGWNGKEITYGVNINDPKYEVLMQFTGLKDKSGKEIYEGDIIGFIYDNGLPTRVEGVVEFGELEYEAGAPKYIGYYTNNNGRKEWLVPRDNSQIDDMVIDNIMENPELLNKEIRNATNT